MKTSITRTSISEIPLFLGNKISTSSMKRTPGITSAFPSSLTGLLHSNQPTYDKHSWLKATYAIFSRLVIKTMPLKYGKMLHKTFREQNHMGHKWFHSNCQA